MRMNNKIKKQVRPQEDLEHICQAIEKNNQHLESFCQRNNMKFPPIIQSRYGNFAQLRLRPLPADKYPQLQKWQSERASGEEGGKVQWIQKKASICKIMFTKADSNKNQEISVHSARLNSNGSNESILRNLRPSKRPFRSQERKKEALSELSVHQTTLHHFIEGLNLTHSQRDSTALFSQSLQATPASNRYQLLSINRMSTINPEADLLRTLRGRNMNLEKSGGETARRGFNPKELSRISFYKHADGIAGGKKIQSLGKRQASIFEPWQGALQEEDFLSEMDK